MVVPPIFEGEGKERYELMVSRSWRIFSSIASYLRKKSSGIAASAKSRAGAQIKAQVIPSRPAAL
ncbi:hypothetical protein D3502_17930 [Salmonella enterica]|nr:hypothetical protein [Salmonella enterica]